MGASGGMGREGVHDEQGFSSFFAIFDDLSMFSGRPNFEKSLNMAKNEEKPRSTCLKPISPQYHLNLQ